MYRATIENRGDSKYYATTRHNSFVIDTEGQGANPVDTLLASLCGCMGHQTRDYMRDQGIVCNGFSVTAEAEPTDDKTRLSDIKVCIDLKDTRLDKQRKSELLKYVEKCMIHGTLKSNSAIHVSLNGA